MNFARYAGSFIVSSTYNVLPKAAYSDVFAAEVHHISVDYFLERRFCLLLVKGSIYLSCCRCLVGAERRTVDCTSGSSVN